MTRSTSDIGLEALVADSTGSSGVWALAAGVVAVGALAAIDREQQRVIEMIKRVPRLYNVETQGGSMASADSERGEHLPESIEFDAQTIECFRDSLPYDEDWAEERLMALREGEPEDKPSKCQWRWGPTDRLLCLEWLERHRRPEAKHYALILGMEPFMHARRDVEEGHWILRKRRLISGRGKHRKVSHCPPAQVWEPGHERIYIELFNADLHPEKIGANVSELARAMLDAYGFKHPDPPWPVCKLSTPKTHNREGRNLPSHSSRFGEREAHFPIKEKAAPSDCTCDLVVSNPWARTAHPGLRPALRRRWPGNEATRVLRLSMERSLCTPPTAQPPLGQEKDVWTPEVTVLHKGEDQPRLEGLEYADQSDASYLER
jgi:hypothetical protein